ncbi:hypothetical protein BH11PLA1_BH11PLA1_22880 [soil metagenome]
MPMLRRSLFALAALVLAVSLLSRPSRADICGPGFDPAFAYPGADAEIIAHTLWDPDGPGPLPPRLLVVGPHVLGASAPYRGTTPATPVSFLDPATGTWQRFPISGTVTALAAAPDGTLYATGLINIPGDTRGVARFRDGVWSALPGYNITGFTSIAVRPNGQLVLGGEFSVVFYPSNESATNLILHDGLNWRPLSPSTTGLRAPGGVFAIAPDGDILVAGNFVNLTGTPVVAQSSVFRWSETAGWHMLGTSLGNTIRTLFVRADGSILAGGAFNRGGSRAARFDGSDWVPFGGITDGAVNVFAESSTGSLYAGGTFTEADGSAVNRMARFAGQSWRPIGLGLDNTVNQLFFAPDDTLFASGPFTAADGFGAKRLVRIRDAAFIRWRGGADFAPTDFELDAHGYPVIVGPFSSVDGLLIRNAACLTPAGWEPLLPPSAPSEPNIRAVLPLPNGDVLVAGNSGLFGFNTVTVVRLSANTLTPLGGGFLTYLNDIVSSNTGEIYISGPFTFIGGDDTRYVARWDGSKWAPLGNGPTSYFSKIRFLADGSLIGLSAVSSPPTGRIERWNGSIWTTILDTGAPTISNIVPHPQGGFVVTGTFTQLQGQSFPGVARWIDGAFVPFNPVPSAPISAVFSILPSGDVLATVQGRPALLSGGTARVAAPSDVVPTFAGRLLPDGSAFFLSASTYAGDLSAGYLARYQFSTCRCAPADIADDAGNPLPGSAANSGVNEGDYNAFFNAFFTTAARGSLADIAGDDGNPLPPFGNESTVNSGVNEGDYNAFFNTFFNGCD